MKRAEASTEKALPIGLQMLKEAQSEDVDEEQKERIWQAISHQLHTSRRRVSKRPLSTQYITAAAAVALIATSGVALFVSRSKDTSTAHVGQPGNVSVPSNPKQPTQESQTQKGVVVDVPVPIDIPPGNMTTRSAFPFSDVSPDGQWIATQDNVGNVAITNVTGKQYEVGNIGNVIYGETPEGDLLFGGNAGGGGIFGIYRPGQGVIQKLDTQNSWTERVSVSSKGHMASFMSNFSGGGPDKKNWFEVDGRKVPTQTIPADYAWSPDGITLACEDIITPPTAGPNIVTPETVAQQEAQLVLYNAVTHQSQVIGNPFPYGEHFVNNSDTVIADAVRDIDWSTDGRYVGVRTANNLQIINVKTGKHTNIPAVEATYNWGFASANELFAIRPDGRTMAFYQVTNDQLQAEGQHRFENGILAYHVIGAGRVAVGDGFGQLDIWTAQSAETILPSGTLTYEPRNQVNSWWYDFVDHNLYYVQGTPRVDAKVYKLPLPPTGGDAQ